MTVRQFGPFDRDSANTRAVFMTSNTGEPIEKCIFYFDYDGSSNLLYLGMALPATATSAATWQIRKFLYTGANLTSTLYAGGTRQFNNIWDNRASLSYS